MSWRNGLGWAWGLVLIFCFIAGCNSGYSAIPVAPVMFAPGCALPSPV
jgi:hypothetical protein